MLKTVEIDNIICLSCKGKKVVLVENQVAVCPNCKGSGKAGRNDLIENSNNKKHLILG